MRGAPLLAALGIAASACHPTSVSGDLASDGGALGSWDFRPAWCVSGAQKEFDGVDLSDGQKNVRLVDDPLLGWAIAVSLSGDPGFPNALLSSPDCTTLQATLGTPSDGSQGGTLDATCATPDGGTLTGSLTFRNCPGN